MNLQKVKWKVIVFFTNDFLFWEFFTNDFRLKNDPFFDPNKHKIDT